MHSEERLLAAFGGLTMELSGWLPPLKPEDHLARFLVPEETPQLRIHVQSCPQLTVPQTEPEYTSFGCCVYSDGGRRTLCYRAIENGTFWWYAVLQYDEAAPDDIDLQVLDRRCRFDMAGLLSCLMMESTLLRHDRAILHAACIAVDGQAILFSAPSGTGKSTQAALWQRYRNAEIINGDKILLRQSGGVELACGLPYAGTSGICVNRSLPIRAIVMLEQGAENRIAPMQYLSAVKALLRQMPVQAWNHGDVERALTAAQRVAGKVPVYQFACLPDESAVCCLENQLK